jgi:hypothetical protein
VKDAPKVVALRELPPIKEKEATPKATPKKAPKKALKPEELYGYLLDSRIRKDKGKDGVGRTYGIGATFRGKAILKAPKSNRSSGWGQKLLDYTLNGETYEELQIRLASDREAGIFIVSGTGISHHLEYDLDHQNVSHVRYLDPKTGKVIRPVPAVLRKARETSKLPALDSKG